MANYIHYTQEQKDRARTTDIVDLLERQGERLKRSGKEYQWRDGSEKVTIRETCGITSMKKLAAML